MFTGGPEGGNEDVKLASHRGSLLLFILEYFEVGYRSKKSKKVP